jgi:hypothetical protein
LLASAGLNKPRQASSRLAQRAPQVRRRIGLGLASEDEVFLLQLGFAFDVILVQWNAIYRADLLALWLVVMADALGAQVRVDDVNFFALGNRSVRALGLADIAVNAIVGNDQGHATAPAQALTWAFRKTVRKLCRIRAADAIYTGTHTRVEDGPA